MIIKTYYPPPARPAPKPSRTLQPDDTVGGHRGGENSPQERPRASEGEAKVVVDSTSSRDEGGDFISQAEVGTGTDNEATQLADRHFELVIFRQQQGMTAKSTDWGGDYLIRADFAGKTNTATKARIAACEEAAISQHRQGTASTDENQQYDPGGTGAEPSIYA